MKTNVMKCVLISMCMVVCMAMPFAKINRTACAGEPDAKDAQIDGINEREISAPAIGFIESPDVFCYQPDPKKDDCYITWGEISVDGSPNYMTQLTVEIEGNVVAVNRGFFQTTMNISSSMLDKGFKVKCGRPGAGGIEDLGNSYSFAIRATDSGGLTATNTGLVVCPAK